MTSPAGIARAGATAALLAGLFLPAFGLAGCAGAEPSKARTDLIVRSVPRTIAIAPLTGIPASSASQLWTLLADAARERGFRIVGDLDAAVLFLDLDRRTKGLSSEDSLAVRWRSALHGELARDLGAEGVMYVGFEHRRARVRNGLAMWDGATERILAVAEDRHDGARGYRGEIEAWSVRLWVEDLDANLVAEGFGGISIDAHLRAGRWESAGAGPKLEEPGVLPAAIRGALAQLTGA